MVVLFSLDIHLPSAVQSGWRGPQMLRRGVSDLSRWPLPSLIDVWRLKSFQIIPAGTLKWGHLPAIILTSSVTTTPVLKNKTKQITHQTAWPWISLGVCPFCGSKWIKTTPHLLLVIGCFKLKPKEAKVPADTCSRQQDQQNKEKHSIKSVMEFTKFGCSEVATNCRRMILR